MCIEYEYGYEYDYRRNPCTTFQIGIAFLPIWY